MSHWACPRCGTRLLFLWKVIRCPRPGCGYTETMPNPVRSADG